MLSGDHPPLAPSGDQPLWSSAILLSHYPIGVHTSFGVSGAKCFPAPGEIFGAQLLGNWLLRRSVTPVFGRSGAMALGSQLPPPFSARPLPDSTPGLSDAPPLQCLATPALGARLRRSFTGALGLSGALYFGARLLCLAATIMECSERGLSSALLLQRLPLPALHSDHSLWH